MYSTAFSLFYGVIWFFLDKMTESVDPIRPSVRTLHIEMGLVLLILCHTLYEQMCIKCLL